MSGTASPSELRLAQRLFVVYLVVSLLAAAVVPVIEGEETLPAHVVSLLLAVFVGIGRWTTRQVAVGFVVLFLVCGVVAFFGVLENDFPFVEWAELPILLVLAAGVIWHVRHRLAVFDEVTSLTTRAAEEAKARAEFSRLTSHEMRSPLTIARGYLERVLAGEVDDETRGDLEVVDDELSRLSRVGDRLLRALALQAPDRHSEVDVPDALAEVTTRWSRVAERRFEVTAEATRVECDPERLRAALDTLVENAVRYTGKGQSIRLTARQRDGRVEIGVADQGPGFAPEVAERVNGGEAAAAGEGLERLRDLRSQTGLGLRIVREVALAHGGRVRIERADSGGAHVLLDLPAVSV